MKPVIWTLGILFLVSSVGLFFIGSLRMLVYPVSMRVKRDIKALEIAIKGYQFEFEKLPQLGFTDETQFIESGGPLLDILIGKGKNPRSFRFYDPPNASENGETRGLISRNGESIVLDHWGNPYRLQFDWNQDGVIASPKDPGSSIASAVIVYSAGPDGDYNTWDDNITSWER